MTIPKDAFRRFQEELAELDRKKQAEANLSPTEARMAQAKREFLALKERYALSIADVVTFFPEEEGVGYLQQLIAAGEAKPQRRKKTKEPEA
jgi:ribosome-interacting GTPase 1